MTTAWTPTTVAIVADGRPRQRSGLVSSAHPAFAITRSDDERYFVVTHLPTSCSAAQWFVTRAAAVALVDAIAPLVDWPHVTQPLEAGDPARAELWRLRADIYRRESDGDFGPINDKWIRYADLSGTRLQEIQRTQEEGEAMAGQLGLRRRSPSTTH
jgi:hypothetical protein